MTKRTHTDFSKEFKEEAVRRYFEGTKGYRLLTKELGIKDCSTLKAWVAAVRRGEELEGSRSKSRNFTGHPRREYSSIEEELEYVKAERDYLKKLYRSRFGQEWGADTSNISLK